MDHQITSLQVQKKNPNRISVYLDGNYAFSVSRIVGAWLQIGQELSDEKIAELQQQETREAALQKALHLLSYRPRSEAEICQKLVGGGFEEEVITMVIERLRSNGLVRDESFAQSWVESRDTFRPRSRKMLAYELKQKGVSEEIIRQTLDKTQDDQAMAYQAASRYARKLEHAEWDEFRRRLTGFLARRGFSYETSASVTRQVWQEIQAGVGDVRISENEDD